MPKMIDLSKDLSASYVEKSERQVSLDEINRELYKREIAITPAEGWPGKNSEQREIEKAKALQADEIWLELDSARRIQQEAIILVDGIIAGMEAERRGFEWEIRANLVTMLAGAAVERNGDGPVEETGFDDTADQVVTDELVFEAVKENAPEPEPLDDAGFEDHPIDLPIASDMVTAPAFELNDSEIPF